MSPKKTQSLHELMEEKGWEESQFDKDSFSALQKLLDSDNDDSSPPIIGTSSSTNQSLDDDDPSIVPESATETERLILTELRNHSKLLRVLQQQVSTLQQQQSQREDNNSFFQQSLRLQQILRDMVPPQRAVPPRQRDPLQERLQRLVDDIMARQGAAPPPAPHPQQRNAHPRRDTILYRCVTLYSAIFQLSRLKVQRFDWGLFIKLCVVSMILLSKVGQSTNTVLLTTFACLFVGVLLYSGWLGLLYYVVVTKNYVYRILVQGEDPNVEAEYRTPPHNQPAGNPPVRQRNHFLQQMMHNNNNDDNANQPVPRAMVDVLLFLSSFLLSIFPMWQLPQPPPAPQEEEEEDDEDQPNVHDDEDDGNNNPPAPQDDGLPQVAPPQDPTGPVEDDDE